MGFNLAEGPGAAVVFTDRAGPLPAPV